MGNNFVAIKLFFFPILQIYNSNIELFYIAPCTVITHDLLCFISSLLLFFIALSIFIILQTIAIEIVNMKINLFPPFFIYKGLLRLPSII